GAHRARLHRAAHPAAPVPPPLRAGGRGHRRAGDAPRRAGVPRRPRRARRRHRVPPRPLPARRAGAAARGTRRRVRAARLVDGPLHRRALPGSGVGASRRRAARSPPAAGARRARAVVTPPASARIAVDGERVATDVVRLDDGTPRPALLMRTPYSRAGSRLTTDAVSMARAGWAVVIQDARGRFDSDG